MLLFASGTVLSVEYDALHLLSPRRFSQAHVVLFNDLLMGLPRALGFPEMTGVGAVILLSNLREGLSAHICMACSSACHSERKIETVDEEVGRAEEGRVHFCATSVVTGAIFETWLSVRLARPLQSYPAGS